jgi:hypothetical protein
VTKSDLSGEPGSAQATQADTLAKLVPGDTIAVYSGIVALWLGVIDEPTPENPDPKDYVTGRFALWALFIVVTAVIAYWAYFQKTAKGSRKPVPIEIAITVLAFAAWGVATPGSWFVEAFDSEVNRVLAPAIVAGVAALLLPLFSTAATKKK